jgi:hypothetical protein
MTRRAITSTVLAAAIAAPAFVYAQKATEKVTEKAFVSGGRIELWLSAGEFNIRPSADNRIRVTLTESIGNTKVELTANGTQGKVVLRDTPNNNFGAVIEVPKTSDLVIRMWAGDLSVMDITGNKDIEIKAGDIRIAADPGSYAKVDASVSVGDLSAGPFGDVKGSFLSKSVNWSGRGKFTLRASLGAGDLKFQ